MSECFMSHYHTSVLQSQIPKKGGAESVFNSQSGSKCRVAMVTASAACPTDAPDIS